MVADTTAILGIPETARSPEATKVLYAGVAL